MESASKYIHYREPEASKQERLHREKRCPSLRSLRRNNNTRCIINWSRAFGRGAQVSRALLSHKSTSKVATGRLETSINDLGVCFASGHLFRRPKPSIGSQEADRCVC